MDKYPEKRRRRRERPGGWVEPPPPTAEELRLLAAFERRRGAFEQALADSNVVYGQHTCPACGFPTLDVRGDYEVCVACCWEDDGEGGDVTLAMPPNYVSIQSERIAVARLLEAFEPTDGIAGSLEHVVRCLREFKRLARRGAVEVDRDDFAANLRRILAAKPAT